MGLQPKISCLLRLQEKRSLASVGHKARNLRLLADGGFRVPQTWVIPWEQFEAWRAGDPGVLPALRAELGHKLPTGRRFAVRSSANVEDGLAHSFAGQFQSILDVSGVDDLLCAVQQVWASAGHAGVETYRQLARGARDVKMAVVIQEMVPAVISGVGFSKNPVTGMDEIVVEAVHGSGEALVQSGQTPRHWVYKWGEWINQPADEDISSEVILEVVTLLDQIATRLRRDIDIEWVYDGEQVWLVQLRDITAATRETIYSNAMAKDMLPGMIKPLVWSVNIPTVTSAWDRFLRQLLGDHGIPPLDLVRQFYYRTYFNMTLLGKAFNQLGFPSESLEMMAGVGGKRGSRMPAMRMHRKLMTKTPRLLGLGWYLLNFHTHLERALPALEAEARTFDWQQADRLDEDDLLAEITRLKALTARAAYFNIVGPILMMAHNAYLRGVLQKRGIDPETVDVMAGLPAHRSLDPGVTLRALNRQFRALDAATQARIQAASYTDFAAMQEIAPFRQAVQAFLERFGHLSDSGNDFSSIPWREAPDLILRVVIGFPEVAASQAEALTAARLPLDPVRRWLLGKVMERVRHYRLCRDQISFCYTQIYGMFRPFFLALGQRMVARGLLESPGDILFLYENEIRAAIFAAPACDLEMLVRQRRQEMEDLRTVLLPGVIYGDTPPPVTALWAEKLTGTATSRGIYTGTARVVFSLDDFGKLENGDVLVVPFSDVSWTPLFARAGGVVAESGGMLSHSSIIAREYHIPAVVSVNGATRLPDGARITVDGYKGEVFIHDTPAAQNRQPPVLDGKENQWLS